MRLGLTYDLRSEYLAAGYGEEETAEFDRDDTIDSIEAALRELGHETDRVGNVQQLIKRLAAGDRWELVFNICEGLRGPGREAVVPALLDAYDIPYTFADPLVLTVSLHKGLTKTVLREHGIPTPHSMLIEEIAAPADVRLRYPLFIKPVSEGTGKGITAASKINSPDELAAGCHNLLEKFRQPVLVEEFLPGREFTTALVGTGDDARVLGTMEIILLDAAEPEVYSYVNKERCEELVEYRLGRPDADPEVAATEALALAAWRVLGGRDAGRVDIRSDATGQPQFIEVNPLAGLHPQHSDLPIIATMVGMPYTELIRLIVDSAAQRVRQPG